MRNPKNRTSDIKKIALKRDPSNQDKIELQINIFKLYYDDFQLYALILVALIYLML